MKAEQFLRKGAELLEERGKQYDQPGGERSMGKAVHAFNTITGCDLYESEGWLLLQLLKDVRQWQNSDKYHADSAEDCVSYAALKAEALVMEQQQRDGWTQEAIKSDAPSKPSWDDAPEWANVLIWSPGGDDRKDYGWADGFFHGSRAESCEGCAEWRFDSIDLKRGHCWQLEEPRPTKEA